MSVYSLICTTYEITFHELSFASVVFKIKNKFPQIFQILLDINFVFYSSKSWISAIITTMSMYVYTVNADMHAYFYEKKNILLYDYWQNSLISYLPLQYSIHVFKNMRPKLEQNS